MAEFFLHAGEDGFGAERGGAAEALGHAVHAEFFVIGVDRFAHAVGVEKKAVALVEFDFLIFGDALEDIAIVDAEGEAGRAQEFDLAGFLTVEQSGIVSGSGDDGFAVVLIQNAVGHADEHVLPDVGEELAVNDGERFGGR